jgi:predicted negative regulator of RcsB-dependent stress response
MNLDTKDLQNKIMPILMVAKRYLTFIFIIAMLFVFVFMVYRINQFSNLEPTDDAVTEKLQTVQRPKVDEAVLEKIQQLQDQNIEAKALFDQARQNPFSE